MLALCADSQGARSPSARQWVSTARGRGSVVLAKCCESKPVGGAGAAASTRDRASAAIRARWGRMRRPRVMDVMRHTKASSADACVRWRARRAPWCPPHLLLVAFGARAGDPTTAGRARRGHGARRAELAALRRWGRAGDRCARASSWQQRLRAARSSTARPCRHLVVHRANLRSARAGRPCGVLSGGADQRHGGDPGALRAVDPLRSCSQHTLSLRVPDAARRRAEGPPRS